MGLMVHIKKVWAWIARRFHAQSPAPSAPPSLRELQGLVAQEALPVQNLNPQHRDRIMEIGPDAWIFSTSKHAITLEGVLIARLVIPPNGSVKIKSPVLEQIRDLSQPGKTMLREWDALYIAEQMIEEYCRGCWYDLADPEDLRTCTLPFPKRSLARIAEKIGLRAERESNSAEVR